MNTAANVETRWNESLVDFVASGCVWSATAGLNASMTAGVVYVNGKRVPIAGIASKAFTASKDTYVSADENGTISYSEVANGGTSPSLPANSVWLAVVITNGSAVTSVDETAIREGSSDVIARRKIGATTDSITIANIPAKRYLRIYYTLLNSGAITASLRFNNDAGNNYGWRKSVSGGAEATAAPAAQLSPDAGGTSFPIHGELLVINIANQEKIAYGNVFPQAAASAATAPVRIEFAGKWVNTSALISTITFVNQDAGDFAASSEIIVIGHD